ncbi:PaaI family thioesterase [Aerophototrophica crusticola]|uniref:PaaI family thioesterase n=1 Tax=Aerophototrophica crusticola TaxID=1709002 RepID=A0A858RBF5_9PROT|nr:PaaI family thioesterase [Rhodospirillaceae bacterium B3]
MGSAGVTPVRKPAAITAAEFETIMLEGLPQAKAMGVRVDVLEHGFCRARLPVTDFMIRPGGTISGPTLFAMADLALYGAVLSIIGAVPLAVTSQMSINFLRKPGLVDLIAESRILRAGKRLAFGDVTLYSDGDAEPVAHASGSYAIPSPKVAP